MALRIACDLDGTLADMDAALQREAKRLFGPDVDLHAAPEPLESAEDVEGQLAEGDATAETTDAVTAGQPGASLPSRRPLTGTELRRLWGHVGETEDFWRSLGEIEPGTVARLADLAARHRWDVLFLTTRPSTAGEPVQLQSQRWLRSHGFEFPSVFVMRGSRGRVAEALGLDAVLDDRPDNCLDVVTDSTAIPFLIWRQRRDAVPAGLRHTRIQAVYSFGEALDRLEALTAERRGRKTVLGRIKSAIGL
jgi:hypothetical protein